MAVKPLGTKGLVFGLAVHFAAWWAVSAWVWLSGFRSVFWATAAPIAPVYLGFFYLQPHGVWQWAAEGLVVTAALLLTVGVAFRKKSWWAPLLAHCALAIYWVAGFDLIATGA